jgi:hypothetical protein
LTDLVELNTNPTVLKRLRDMEVEIALYRRISALDLLLQAAPADGGLAQSAASAARGLFRSSAFVREAVGAEIFEDRKAAIMKDIVALRKGHVRHFGVSEDDADVIDSDIEGEVEGTVDEGTADANDGEGTEDAEIVDETAAVEAVVDDRMEGIEDEVVPESVDGEVDSA